MGFEEFFSSRKARVRMGPKAKLMETPWAAQNRLYLQGLQSDYEAPELKIAGMSANESKGQGILAKILAGDAQYDPATSPYYQGMRQELQAEEEQGAGAVRRFAQKAGMTRSSTALKSEGQYREGMSNKRLQLLGQLLMAERARDNEYTRVAASSQYGGLPRQLEQAQNQASFNQENQTTAMKADAAQQLLSYQPWYQRPWYMTEAKPSRFSEMIAGMMKGFSEGSKTGNPYAAAGMAVAGGAGGATA